MKIPAYPHTESVCVLIGAKDERGIYKMLSESKDSFGISIALKPTLPLLPQVIQHLEKSFAMKRDEINFASEVAEEVSNLYSKNYLLLLATADKLPSGDFYTETFPDLLRRLPQERVRLPFLRVWQILMGSHLEVQSAETFEDLPN